MGAFVAWHDERYKVFWCNKVIANVHPRITVVCILSSTTFSVRIILLIPPRPGSVVVERSPGMREVGGSIPRPRQTKDVKNLRFCCSA